MYTVMLLRDNDLLSLLNGIHLGDKPYTKIVALSKQLLGRIQIL